MYYAQNEDGSLMVSNIEFVGSTYTEKYVERSWNGALYFEGDPRIEKPQSAIDAERVAEIKSQLSEIDAKSARPLRAVVAGTATDDDRAALVYIEAKAQELRDELATLEPKKDLEPDPEAEEGEDL